ncbi:MAG: NAD(P)/FAD-dependent oxidoreductase, partial [Rikenellaceae bacterium]|nr:NAD(P)/FAD-dependent oxidoreductase [Rikenellaceae bacterium]
QNLYQYQKFIDTHIPRTGQKRVVIVGGGFGGLKATDELRKTDYQVVLVDRNNYHEFPPLFYQVASAGLEAGAILFPFRKIFQKRKNFHFRMAEVHKVNPEEQTIECSHGTFRNDNRRLAAGCKPNFFHNTNIEQNALAMKSAAQALNLRNKILENFEQALLTSDPERQQEYTNIVVVGGGATGVEVAGAMAEMKRYVLRKDYPDLDIDRMRIFLIEGADKLLNNMSAESSERAAGFLRKMGVTLLTGKLVTDYADATVKLNDLSAIRSRCVIWTSGITAHTFEGIDPQLLDRGNRIAVDEFNRVKGYTDLFAIGDLASLTNDPDYPKGHPQVAQTALQQGRNVARNLRHIERGEPLRPFRYKNKGTLATVGRNKAVADIGKLKLHGFAAWIIWSFVHLMTILGAQNKIIVFINWTWNYLSYDQSLRLILRPKK